MRMCPRRRELILCRKHGSTAGFTIVELLLVIALIAVVAAFVVSVYVSTARAFIVSSDTEAALTLIRDAQHEAARALYDSNTGVHIEEGLLTSYVGDSYATRDEVRDRTQALVTAVNAELPLAIQFTASTGETSERYELSFTDSVHERTIVIEQSGLVYFAP
jgi:prepilin-type N-terminal cleavage/methylation domain-containing protein